MARERENESYSFRLGGRERERGKKGKSETESFPPVYFSTLEKNKSLRFSLRNEGGKRGKNEKGERKRLLLADPV